MPSRIAHQTLECLREFDERSHLLVAFVLLDQLGAGQLLRAAAEGVSEGDADAVGDQLGDRIAHAVAEPEHPTDVAHRRLRRHRAEGDDLADPIASVALGDVLDHLVAPFHAEVDIEIRHRDPLGVEEALEEEVEAQRVEIGDAERPGDQRARPRAAPRTDGDPLLARPADEIGDDEEIPREAHALDDGKLLFEPLPIVVGRGGGLEAFRREPCREPLLGLRSQEFGFASTLRRGKGGQGVLAQAKLGGAAYRDLERVLDGFRQVREQRMHLLAALQELFGGGGGAIAALGEELPAGDRHPNLVRLVVAAIEESHFVVRDRRDTQAPGEGERPRLEGGSQGVAGAGDGEVDSVRMEAGEVGEGFLRELGASAQEKSAHSAVFAEEQDQPSAELLEPVGSDPGGVPRLLLTVGVGEQKGEIAKALHVQAEGSHPPGLLFAFAFDPEVGAEDRLDACGLGGAIELDRGEKVHRVGEGERRQRSFSRRGDQPFQAQGAVEQRVLAVQAKMREGPAHGPLSGEAERPAIAARTGAKLRRCSGHGPCRRSRCRCMAVG